MVTCGTAAAGGLEPPPKRSQSASTSTSAWVDQHADELVALRLGGGVKPRLRWNRRRWPAG